MKTPRGPIRISLMQVDPTPPGSRPGIQETLEKVRRTAKGGPGILVLPEIWSGGFAYPGIRRLASKTPEILKALCEISGRYGTTIIGSLPEKGAKGIYNSAAVVDRGRIAGRYRKQRLFSPLGEDRHFVTGPSRRTFATEHGVLAVAVCFDLRFPELFADLRERGAWLLVVPAQWPAVRRDHWEALLPARALESQIYVAGCNRVGRTGGTRFAGGSLLVDPWGKVLARGSGRPQIRTHTVDPGRVREVRRRIPMGGRGRSR